MATVDSTLRKIDNGAKIHPKQVRGCKWEEIFYMSLVKKSLMTMISGFMLLNPLAVWGRTDPVTVKDVLSDAYKNQEVSVEGVVVRVVNYDTLLLQDLTGQLEVVMEDDDHVPEKAMKEGHPVRIYGTVKTGYVRGIILEFDTAEIIPGKQMSDFDIDQVPVLDGKQAAMGNTSTEGSPYRDKEEKLLLDKIGSALVPKINRGSANSLNVSSVLKENRKGQSVILSGAIIRQINYETYLFADETGQIEIILEDDDHMPEKALKEGHPVEIQGVVRGGGGKSPFRNFCSENRL